MYQKLEENSGGQPLCPSRLRDGELGLKKSAGPSSKKKSYLPIILSIIFLCGFMLIASLLYGIASSKGHRVENSFQMTFQLIYNGLEKKNESSLSANLYDKENKPMVDEFDMMVKALEVKLEEKYDSFKGYIGYHTLLEIDVEAQPNFLEIHWFYNRKQIDTSNKEKYKLHDGALEIKNLTENDTGNYKCLLVYDGSLKIASYDLKIQHAYKWVVWGSPEMKDPAFKKFSFNNEFNFGHTDNGESLVPGVIHENCFSTIEMLNDDIKKTDKFKILMINKNVEYDWVEDSDGHVPANALEAGQLANGEILYIGSTLDSQKLGLVHPNAEVMHLFITDEELMKDDYKVLVLKI